MRNWRHIALRLLFYTFVGLFALNVSLQMYYAYTAPSAAQPENGKIYPLRVHRTVIYLNRWEAILAGPPALLLAFACGAVWVFFEWRLRYR
jgi:hypothetical protein